MSSLTAYDVKKKNKEKILEYIYTQRSTHQQQICETLHLSRPTVIPIIRECEEQFLIEKNGFFESTGGRKAVAIHFIPDIRIAIGVELIRESFEIAALNLYGETICIESFDCPFSDSDEYYEKVCRQIRHFIVSHGLDAQKILGIGIVLQGLISSDGTCVTYGKILNCTGLTIDVFTKRLPFPCMFFHDAESAAQDELWQSPGLINAIYINIRSHVSGAVVVNRGFLQGTELKSGVFEHMTLVPDGRPCYCGHRGCMETYCSTAYLTRDASTLEEFFLRLRSGDAKCRKTWNEYLRYLASSINNLRMFIDYPVILGGTLAPFLQGSDIVLLHRLVYEHTAFPTSQEFIRPSCCPNSPICRGAALPFVRKYLQQLTGLQ